MNTILKDRIDTPPNVVCQFSIGNAKIRIADDYCRDVTAEEIERVINRIQRIALDAWQKAGHGAEDR